MKHHKTYLIIFFIISIAHLMEHILQMFQVHMLCMAEKDSLGMLGYFLPELLRSEVLHYAYALVMLIGLIVLRPGFAGKALFWWDMALYIQIWHHFEHVLLIWQYFSGHNLFNSPVPISLVQLFIPRVELHFFYNLIVLIPMIIAMYYYRYKDGCAVVYNSCNSSGGSLKNTKKKIS